MSRLKSPFAWFVLAVLTTAALTALGPEERSLGDNLHIVYLHAAWVLTSEAAFLLAAAAGLIGILFRRVSWQRWSTALGRTGLFFWVSSLPLSLWAMQANWNGLFLAEPRFRLGVIFAAAGVLLQVCLTLLSRPVFTALFNVLFFAALEISLRQADYVMHPPPSPILSSGILTLELYFVSLLFLTAAGAYFLTRWWLKRQG